LSSVLDVLVKAGHALAASPDVTDSLTQMADLCVADLADFCAIQVVVEALERNEFAVEAGIHPERPAGSNGTIVQALSAGRYVTGSIRCETAVEGGFDATTRQAINLLGVQLAIVVAGHAAAMREHRVADRFQRALLPAHLPEVAEITFHASYRPASDEAEVGGDWYDAFALGDGRIAISIGDVAGHGLDAAVIMGEVRQVIRTAAVGGAAPAELLEYVNSVVRLRESIGMVTAIFGIYHPGTSVLSYAVAGHPPPALSLIGGVTRSLPSGGLPLGCATSIDATDWTFTIPAGGRVVFYTDGLIENERDLIAGEERLMQTIAALGWTPADDPAEAIQQGVFGAVSNRDDAAVLALTRNAPVQTYVFSALPVIAPLVRAIVEREVVRLQMSDDRRFGVLVAVGEAIANAVEHAYRGGTPGLIRMTVESDERSLVVTIEDFGRWRPFVKREERGRGIELMHAFMDGVQIRTTRESTAIVLKADLHPSAEAV
jgi:anti-sigma regulatory factor (Ser/Thr protein kinase)